MSEDSIPELTDKAIATALWLAGIVIGGGSLAISCAFTSPFSPHPFCSMEETPTYGVTLLAVPPAPLSYEELLSEATVRAWAVGTHLTAVTTTRHYPARQYPRPNYLPARSDYRVAIYDLRTASSAQILGRWVLEAKGATPAECLADLRAQLQAVETA